MLKAAGPQIATHDPGGNGTSAPPPGPAHGQAAAEGGDHSAVPPSTSWAAESVMAGGRLPCLRLFCAFCPTSQPAPPS